MKMKNHYATCKPSAAPKCTRRRSYLLPFCFCPTVHKDVTERLAAVDPELWEQVKGVLSVNLQERHLRGGDATKKKYENRKVKE